MDIHLSVDVAESIQQLTDVEKRSVPYAAARTLTRLAQIGQRAVRESLPDKFHLRNDWTLRGIRITPARKADLQAGAMVRTDTENRATGAPDYLVRQEEGGEKVPFGGRLHLAVPTRHLRELNGGGPIRGEFRPRALLDRIGNRYTQPLTDRTRGARKSAASVALVGASITAGWEFFINRSSTGHLILWGRNVAAHSREIVPMYVLVHEVTVRPRLDMDATVAQAVAENFESVWEETWKEIYAKGLRI